MWPGSLARAYEGRPTGLEQRTSAGKQRSPGDRVIRRERPAPAAEINLRGECGAVEHQACLQRACISVRRSKAQDGRGWMNNAFVGLMRFKRSRLPVRADGNQSRAQSFISIAVAQPRLIPIIRRKPLIIESRA